MKITIRRSQYSVIATVGGLTHRESKANAYRLAAAVEDRSGGWGWVTGVEQNMDHATDVRLELIKGDEAEFVRAEQILRIAARHS